MRSQDRGSIVKVDNLYISVGNYICYYVEKGKEIPNTYFRPSGELGKYKSFERAVEVLDEIQEILKPKTIIKFNEKEVYDEKENMVIGKLLPYETFDIKQLSTYVYEMPID